MRARTAATRALLWAAAKVDGHFAEYAMVIVAKRSPEALRRFIQERASGMAVGITMSILDREGISHCSHCPQRFGLRKSAKGGRYVCLKHSQEEARAEVALNKHG